MDKEVKSILWECRRVLRWSKPKSGNGYHDNHYKKLDKTEPGWQKHRKNLNKNYLGLHTVGKIPFDLSKGGGGAEYYDFVCPISSFSFNPIRISVKMLKIMHELKLGVQNRRGKGMEKMSYLGYGSDKIFIYILADAMDKVGVEDFSKFFVGSKKRKRTEKKKKSQVSQKRIKKSVFHLDKFKNRARGIDDILPTDIIVPAMILPFPRPFRSLGGRAETGYILQHTSCVLYPNCEDSLKYAAEHTRELSDYFMDTWVGWYKDYGTTEPWPYILWKDEIIPRPMHAKVIHLIGGVRGTKEYLRSLQEKNKKFQLANLCEAVKKAEFNVDFKMMKKFGLTRKVKRGEKTYAAPLLISKDLVHAVKAREGLESSPKKEIEIDENSRESSPGVELATDAGTIDVSWQTLSDIVSSCSSSSSTTVSKKHTKSHFEEKEENIKLVDALPSNNNNNIVSRQPFAGHSKGSALSWNVNWVLGGACVTLDSIPLPDQLKCLNTGQTVGENLFNHHKTHIQELEDKLHDAKAELKQVDCGLMRIGQEKKFYTERKLKKSKKVRENLKKRFGEHVDGVDDESILSPGAEGQGKFWLGLHFKELVTFFSTPLPPRPQVSTDPLLRLSTNLSSPPPLPHKKTRVFLKDVPGSDALTKMLGGLEPTDNSPLVLSTNKNVSDTDSDSYSDSDSEDNNNDSGDDDYIQD